MGGLDEMFNVILVIAGFVWLWFWVTSFGNEDGWPWGWKAALVLSILLFVALAVEYLSEPLFG